MLKGIREVFVLAFLNVKTRQVILSPATYKPDAEWVEQQAEAFVEQARGEDLPVARLIRDNDGSFSTVFDEALRRKHVKIVKTQFRSPNMNAFVERFVQSIQQECLDHFIIVGTQHMDVLCREYLAFYHTERPHQGRDNKLLVCESPPKNRETNSDVLKLSDISCSLRLGGLLKSYSRKAA